MFFLKPKPKSDELLPPPPPFPTMDIEELPNESNTGIQLTKKPKFASETSKAKAEAFPEIQEFDDLVKSLNKDLKPGREKTTIDRKKNIKKTKVQKAVKNQHIRQIKNITSKQARPGKKSRINAAKNEVKKSISTTIPELDEDFGIDNLQFDFAEEKTDSKSIEFPDKLEDFGIDNFGNELDKFSSGLKQEKFKPKAVAEAEEEIKSAIENIKRQEKPSFFKSLFKKRKKTIETPAEDNLASETQELDNISSIQNSIKTAREALMKFDVNTAKIEYIEVMKLYNRLNPQEKSKVYNDINELYLERKSAEGLSA